MKRLLKPTATKRLFFFLAADITIFTFSLYLAFLLRFDFDIIFFKSSEFYSNLGYLIVFFSLTKISLFFLGRLYKISWQFVSLSEFFKINLLLFSFMAIASILNYLFYFYYGKYMVPRSIPLIDFFISLALVSILRVSKRVYKELIRWHANNDDGIKTLIIGAGYAGERIARELLLVEGHKYIPIGFLDDDKTKQGIYIHNIRVIGTLQYLKSILKTEEIDLVIIAIPSLHHSKIKMIYETCKNMGINQIKIVPSINKMSEYMVTVKDLKEIDLDDLMAREPVNIDMSEVSELVNGKNILVTGAAGSIGSEIVRQLCRFSPKEIIAFEIDDTELHNLSLDLNRHVAKYDKAITLKYIIGDVRDKIKTKHLFENNKIDIVFHAAAYKHVPLMEFFPEEALKTNLFGTYNIARWSYVYGVEKFVNISTDKAVNPTSVMGATKRLSEIVCSAFNAEGSTQFISVRFGNVLGSRGSVIPIFLEQIKNGGPITVTHPEMKRYFMTIPEAVLLVFQAAAMGQGGEVFVLDMGEPVKIVSLAEELIRLNGLRPYDDIDITYSGLRPGEKLFEELLTAEEGTVASKHSKIFVAKIFNGKTLDDIELYVREFEKLIQEGNFSIIKQKLKEIIPFYKES